MEKNPVYIIIIIILCLQSCNTTEPGKTKFEIAFEDASCTEVWIKVTGETGNEFILNRDDKEVQRFTLTTTPKTIYDDSLLPNKTYSYQVTGIGNQETSSKLSVTTLDTTSNNFTWQTWTFGDGNAGSSVLYDCAIISEDDIWCVGEINIADSSENGYTTYNAVHWNGNEWELKRITVSFRGFQITPLLEGAIVFPGRDIWFVGSLPIHDDGENWIIYDLRTTVDPNLSLSKAWANNSDNIYFVGLNGSIAHYKNGQWLKIESGTDLPFQDIWGDNGEVLAIASDKFGFGGKYLVSLSGNNARQIPTEISTALSFSSIWFKSNRKYFLAGNGVYAKESLADSTWELDPIAKLLVTYFYSIRGSGLNNIVTVGEGSYIAHFNGVSWKIYDELRNPPDRLLSVAVTEHMIVAVGNKYLSGIENYGLVYLGRRQE